MTRWTLAQRASLAQTCAASEFNYYADPAKRGQGWMPDHMPGHVRMHTIGQCRLAAVPEKHHEATGELAVRFYQDYLDAAMRRIL